MPALRRRCRSRRRSRRTVGETTIASAWGRGRRQALRCDATPGPGPPGGRGRPTIPTTRPRTAGCARRRPVRGRRGWRRPTRPSRSSRRPRCPRRTPRASKRARSAAASRKRPVAGSRLPAHGALPAPGMWPARRSTGLGLAAVAGRRPGVEHDGVRVGGRGRDLVVAGEAIGRPRPGGTVVGGRDTPSPDSGGPGHARSPPSSSAASCPMTRSIHTRRPAVPPPESS